MHEMNLDMILADEGHDPIVPAINHDLQLGFVEVVDNYTVDPGLRDHLITSDQKIFNADAIRMWAKHFSPTGLKEWIITIPADWMTFFTNILLSPTHFTWAKNFLASQAWHCFQKQSMPHGMSYLLPISCPSEVAPICSFNQISSAGKNFNSEEEVEQVEPEEEVEQDEPESMEIETTTPTKQYVATQTASESTPALHKHRKRQRQVPVVDTDYRRGDRVREINKRFRRSSCPHRNCLVCDGAPPTLSPKIIKDLGATFCQIGPEILSEAALSTTKAMKKAVEKKPSKKKEEQSKSSKITKKSKNGKKTPKTDEA